MIPKGLLALAAAALLPIASAQADGFNAGTETAVSGTTTATLSWDHGELGPQNTTLTISRAGAVAFQRQIPEVCGSDCSLSAADGSSFQVVDLDRDGEPEVLLQTDNSLDCCATMGIFDFRPATGTYGELTQASGSSFQIEDADGDGHQEIVTTDARLKSLLGTVFLPVRVFKFERPGGVGRLRDATRSFKKLIREDAAEQKGVFKLLTHNDFSAPHVIGAYVADEYLLGRGSVGLKEMDKQLARHVVGSPKASKRFRAKLLTLLHRNGYR